MNFGKASGKCFILESSLIEREAKGLKKGLKKGCSEEREVTVINAFRNHFTIEEIRLITRLGKEEILDILKQQNRKIDD